MSLDDDQWADAVFGDEVFGEASVDQREIREHRRLLARFDSLEVSWASPPSRLYDMIMEGVYDAHIDRVSGGSLPAETSSDFELSEEAQETIMSTAAQRQTVRTDDEDKRVIPLHRRPSIFLALAAVLAATIGILILSTAYKSHPTPKTNKMVEEKPPEPAALDPDRKPPQEPKPTDAHRFAGSNEPWDDPAEKATQREQRPRKTKSEIAETKTPDASKPRPVEASPQHILVKWRIDRARQDATKIETTSRRSLGQWRAKTRRDVERVQMTRAEAERRADAIIELYKTGSIQEAEENLRILSGQLGWDAKHD